MGFHKLYVSCFWRIAESRPAIAKKLIIRQRALSPSPAHATIHRITTPGHHKTGKFSDIIYYWAKEASQSGEKGKTKVETKVFVFTGVGSSASSDLVQVWRCLRSPVYLYASEKTSPAVTSSNIKLGAASTTAKAVAMGTLAMVLPQNLENQCRPLEA